MSLIEVIKEFLKNLNLPLIRLKMTKKLICTILLLSIVILSGCTIKNNESSTDSQVPIDSGVESRCYVSPFSELISQSELIVIGIFDDYSTQYSGLNKYPKFINLDIIKGSFNSSEITVMGGGGTLSPNFIKGRKYILFLRDFNKDGIYDLGCIPRTEDYEIKTDDSGNEIMGCLRDFNKCVREEIPCPDKDKMPEPIVYDAEGNVIPQPPQPERKCYSEGYSILEDVIDQIQNRK